jgi:hypothetical protein
MNSVGIFYAHFECITAISNFVVILVIFPRFGILCQDKSGNPDGMQLDFESMKPPAEHAAILNGEQVLSKSQVSRYYLPGTRCSKVGPT